VTTQVSPSTGTSKSETTVGVLKRFVQIAFTLLLQAALLFISAGTMNWLMAWVYLGIYMGGVILVGLLVVPKNPEMIAERAQPKENVKTWDKVIAAIAGVASLLTLIVAGLDVRFGWSPHISPTIVLLSATLLALGYALFAWGMASNKFFSTVVRIQDDRGHSVASAGPYQYVRHPGYVGWIIMSIATPLMLGSLWALSPGALSALFMVFRTALEDKTLQAELAGYKDYAARVRYRLLPGLW
jgi:protein-S-isoprenylcysteine O-methyltransferase Ste14